MKSSVKYNFDIAFDGGHSDSVMQIKMFYEKKLEDIKIEFEDLGFSKGYSYAISGIENNKMESLKNIEKLILSLFTKINEFESHHIAQSAKAAYEIAKILNGKIIKYFPKNNLDHIISELIAQIIETPRLVFRIPENDSILLRQDIETIIKNNGFLGKIIFIEELGRTTDNIVIEWANGGVQLENAQGISRISNELDDFIEHTLNTNLSLEKQTTDQHQ